jgi:uncharacterized protein YjgD (DUF1641 family)
MTTAVDLGRLDALEDKIDRLADQVALLTQYARDEQNRRRQWDELRTELTPVAQEAFAALSRELDDVRDFVEPQDLLRVLKRLARNLPAIERGLDQLESLQDLAADLGPLSGEITLNMMRAFDDFEQRGYFAFAKGGVGVLDRVVNSFSEEDIAQFGDNIVLILNTVKEMTQPEVMRLLQRTASHVRMSEPREVGLFAMMRRLRDPSARRGLGRLLEILESMGESDTIVDPAAGSAVEDEDNDEEGTH